MVFKFYSFVITSFYILYSVCHYPWMLFHESTPPVCSKKQYQIDIVPSILNTWHRFEEHQFYHDRKGLDSVTVFFTFWSQSLDSSPFILNLVIVNF